MTRTQYCGHRQSAERRRPIVTLLFGLLATAITIVPATRARGETGEKRPSSRLPLLVREVGFEQRLGEPVPPELSFVDETGNNVTLGDFFGDKPTVLLLVQYRCPMLCNLVLNGLAEAMNRIPLDLGHDYRVVAVSIDPREKSPLAAEKRAHYLDRYMRSSATDPNADWHFLTGEQSSIERLADAIGYRYSYDPRTDQFAHPSGLVMITPGGRISRYFFGVRYLPNDVRLGLVESAEGTIDSPTSQLLLLCYGYDPASGRYTFQVLTAIRLAGAVTLVLLIGSIAWMLVRENKRGRDDGVREDNGRLVTSD